MSYVAAVGGFLWQFGLPRAIVLMICAASFVTAIIFGLSAEKHERAMVAAYFGSALFWFVASLAADLARPQPVVAGQEWPKPQLANLANAIAASLAALGTTAGVQNGWQILFG